MRFDVIVHAPAIRPSCRFMLAAALLCGLAACTPWLHGPNYWAVLEGYPIPVTRMGEDCGGRTAPGLRFTPPGGVSVGLAATWREKQQKLDVSITVEVPPGKSAKFEHRVITVTDPDTMTTIEWDPPYLSVDAAPPSHNEWVDFLGELDGGSDEFQRHFFATISIPKFNPERLEINVPALRIGDESLIVPTANFRWVDRRQPGLLWACV